MQSLVAKDKFSSNWTSLFPLLSLCQVQSERPKYTTVQETKVHIKSSFMSTYEYERVVIGYAGEVKTGDVIEAFAPDSKAPGDFSPTGYYFIVDRVCLDGTPQHPGRIRHIQATEAIVKDGVARRTSNIALLAPATHVGIVRGLTLAEAPPA